jgi:hypothetical protein
MAALQPVAPEGYTMTSMFAPKPAAVLQPVAPQGSINDMPLLQRQSMLASMTPEQRQAAVNPVAAPVAPTAPARSYSMAELNNMPLLQRQAAIDAMDQQQRAALAGPGPTYNGSALVQTDPALRQAGINAAQGGPNLYGGMGITPEGAAYKKAFTPTQAQLAAMQANPALAQRYVAATQAGRNRVAAIGQQRRDYIQQQMAARSAAMNGGGWQDALKMIPGVGAAMALSNMSQGKSSNPMSLIGPAMSLLL